MKDKPFNCKCGHCGLEIYRKPNEIARFSNVFCCRKCRWEHHKNSISETKSDRNRKCEYIECLAEYRATTERQKYCSYGCAMNDRIGKPNPYAPKGLIPWNKGLKADSNKIMAQIRDKMTIIQKNKSKDGALLGCCSSEWLKSEANSEAGRKGGAISGGYRKGSGRGRGAWFERKDGSKVYCDSSYEIAYAQYLEENGINWIKNYAKFPYKWDDKDRFYIPDFYFPETQNYIEVKGYCTEKDKAKWASFPHELKVLYRQDLIALGLKVK